MYNVLALMNSDAYQQEFSRFLGSIDLPKIESTQTAARPTASTAQPSAARTGKFRFTETRFDDGWVALEQEDWVRAAKGGTTVLIHYAMPDIRSFNNLDEASVAVWNKLVAPRYSDLKNFYARRSWYADGDFMNGKYYVEGDVTDPATGRRVFVALFKNGNSGKWLEFILPDKGSFQREFTIVYTQDGTKWEALAEKAKYNSFVVAPEDVNGVWKSSSATGVDLYNVYTGSSVGMATTSSSYAFTFAPNGAYTEVYKSASGVGAGLNYYGQTNRGKFGFTSNRLTLTNRFKGQPHTFTAWFEAVKGGRILHLVRGEIEEIHLVKAR